MGLGPLTWPVPGDHELVLQATLTPWAPAAMWGEIPETVAAPTRLRSPGRPKRPVRTPEAHQAATAHAIRLRRKDGLTYQEIGEELGTNADDAYRLCSNAPWEAVFPEAERLPQRGAPTRARSPDPAEHPQDAAFRMRKDQDMTFAAIGVALGVSRQRVLQMVRRAERAAARPRKAASAFGIPD